MRPTAYRITTSSPVERAFMTRKSWQHPGRRRHIHGPLVPLESSTTRTFSNAVVIGLFVVVCGLSAVWGFAW